MLIALKEHIKGHPTHRSSRDRRVEKKSALLALGVNESVRSKPQLCRPFELTRLHRIYPLLLDPSFTRMFLIWRCLVHTTLYKPMLRLLSPLFECRTAYNIGLPRIRMDSVVGPLYRTICRDL